MLESFSDFETFKNLILNYKMNRVNDFQEMLTIKSTTRKTMQSKTNPSQQNNIFSNCNTDTLF